MFFLKKTPFPSKLCYFFQKRNNNKNEIKDHFRDKTSIFEVVKLKITLFL